MSNYKIETVEDLYERGFTILQVVHVSEIEAMEEKLKQAEARVAELESVLSCIDKGAWLLRKQADAIEEIFDLFSGSRNRYIADQKIKWLRLQADEAENE